MYRYNSKVGAKVIPKKKFRMMGCGVQGGIKYCTSWEPIQHESDATKDVQNSGNLGISSYDKKYLTVA